MHELRYFKHVISMSDDIEILWLEKCELIVNKRIRWHEALRIYFDGKDEWLFDFLPTPSEASKIVAEASLPTFLVCSLQKKAVKNVVL